MRALTQPEAKVLFKLYRNRCFGEGHMLRDNVRRGFPRHEVGHVEAAIDGLLRDGILAQHPTRHGKALHVHARLRLEVYDALRELPAFAWLPK